MGRGKAAGFGRSFAGPPIIAAAILVCVVSGSGPQLIGSVQATECWIGDKIDNSSTENARKKMEAENFRQVNDLRKGCDNFWHAKATKDGAVVNIVLSPQGKVMIEGN